MMGLRSQTVIDVRHLTPHELQGLGVSQLAYVKSVHVEGEAAFAIHAADGTPMALAETEDLAIAAIQENEMVPARVH